MKLLYFATFRERLGLEEEMVDLPAQVKTVGDLISWQKTRDSIYEAVFSEEEIIFVAVDQRHVDDDFSLDTAQEVAFFPPMTGG